MVTVVPKLAAVPLIEPIVEPTVDLATASLASATFRRAQRLDTAAVGEVLKRGRRIASAHRKDAPAGTLFTARLLARQFLPSPSPSPSSPLSSLPPSTTAFRAAPARLAIAAPKRLFKRAVDRNRIKRWVREAFRQHALRWLPVDVLITVNAKAVLTKDDQCQALKAALHEVLDASAREQRSRAAPARGRL